MKKYIFNTPEEQNSYEETKSAYQDIINHEELLQYEVEDIDSALRICLIIKQALKAFGFILILRGIATFFVSTTIPSTLSLFFIIWILLSYLEVRDFNRFLDIYIEEEEGDEDNEEDISNSI